jgi:hypothetical protein
MKNNVKSFGDSERETALTPVRPNTIIVPVTRLLKNAIEMRRLTTNRTKLPTFSASSNFFPAFLIQLAPFQLPLFAET